MNLKDNIKKIKLLNKANKPLAENKKSLDSNARWISDAIKLDVYNSDHPEITAITNQLFNEITSEHKFKSPDKAKQALKTIIINLWFGYLLHRPVSYSRSKKDYRKDQRYGQLFFTYATIIPLCDLLDAHEYVRTKKGRSSYNNKKKGWYSRMWASQKLHEIFEHQLLWEYNITTKPKPEEVIILNKKNIPTSGNKKRKIPVKYRETKTTMMIRDNLEAYNNFVLDNSIKLCCSFKDKINWEFIFNNLCINLLNSRYKINYINICGYYSKYTKTKHINLNILNLNKYKYTFNLNNKHKYITNNIYTNSMVLRNNLYNINTTITRSFCREMPIDVSFKKSFYDVFDLDFIVFIATLRKYFYKNLAFNTEGNYEKKHEELRKELKKPFPLNELGLTSLVLKFTDERLHRVFNKESFKHGGRAYGACYQKLPKHLRKYITINTEATVELDYSALHIRMLYHLKEINYLDDPYIACAGPEYREVFKTAFLVIINADNEDKAMGAIREQLKENMVPLPKVKHPLKWIVEQVKKAHQPISEFICSGMGSTLQNLDSTIMDGVLMKLMGRGILGLSVFDSVIVARQYEDILRQIMTEEYEKVMRFQPQF